MKFYLTKFPTSVTQVSHLLLVAGCVGQHCGHVEHDSVAVEVGVQGVIPR